ncbi:hypothetical protein [Fervidibacillus halotolerans]
MSYNIIHSFKRLNVFICILFFLIMHTTDKSTHICPPTLFKSHKL